MKNRFLRITKSQFFRFSVVGSIGFIVDAGIVWLLSKNHIHPIIAQIIAFSIAVVFTWLLNRKFSFPNSKKKWFKQLFSYVLGTSIGSIANNGIYVLLVLEFKLFFNKPVFAVAVGSLVGLVFNFTVSKFWVFR